MKAKKSLGQNFLIDNNIITEIISLFNCNEKDLIIEIGPGRGALTSKLVKLNCNLLCIEVDKDMKIYLDNLESEKCSIIYDDILNVNLQELLNSYDYENLYVIGNLPYYITSPIMEHIVKSGIAPKEMVFMVQKEVAERFCAKPGNRQYGYMTIFLNHYYSVSMEISVPAKCFNPVPKVDSAVIKLVHKDIKYNLSDEKYFDFLKEAFRLKRKTLKNNLVSYDWNLVKLVLDTYEIKENVRAEELSENILIKIYNALNRN